MSWPEILLALAAIVGSGGVGAIVVKLIDRRAASEESEIQRLRVDVAACTEKHADCERKYEQLEIRLRAVEASTPSYLARWVKGQDKRLLWCNDRAYMTMFAPLGWARDQVLDKTFEELLGEGSGSAIRLLDKMDRAALRRPGQVQSVGLQLHPDLPTMIVAKVAFAAEDGNLRYEGCSFVPNQFATDIGAQRQIEARTNAAEELLDRKDRA